MIEGVNEVFPLVDREVSQQHAQWHIANSRCVEKTLSSFLIRYGIYNNLISSFSCHKIHLFKEKKKSVLF
jgi:hypothetical protein